VIGFPGASPYCAAKFAVEGSIGKITAMRNEIEQWRELSVSTERSCAREELN
jgi:hypothetical protein